MNKRIIYAIAMLTLWVGFASVQVNAEENENVYLTGVNTSYAHPETGEITDGGSNAALGESMCAGIMEDTALIEYSADGKIYITMGFGLASNIGETTVWIRMDGENYEKAELTQTGSCERDGDTCIHYRFEIPDENVLIKPDLEVIPMGRNVEFYIQLDNNVCEAGMGSFVSEIAAAAAIEKKHNTPNGEAGNLQSDSPTAKNNSDENNSEDKDINNHLDEKELEESNKTDKDHSTDASKELSESGDNHKGDSESRDEKKISWPLWTAIAAVIVLVVLIFWKKKSRES